MAEFLVSSVSVVNTGNALEVPQVVSVLSEENESRMVKLECIELVDAAQWGQFGTGFFAGGFDVDVTDGTNQNVMRIDFNCDIFELPPFEGHFTAVGIGAQMDESSPFTVGYKFFPRYLLDISEEVVASFIMPNPLEFGDNGAEVEFINSGNTGSYSWDFGDGSASSEQSPTHSYTYDFLSATPQVTVSLTTTVDGCADTQSQTVDAIYTLSVAEAVATFEVFPNPAGDMLTIRSTQAGKSWSIRDAKGQVVVNNNTPFSGDIQLPLDSLAAGAYIIQLEYDTTVISKRFVKF
jgi:hypothetical protein